ncbi:glycosyltransferase [Pyrobaculum sp.]|uniref:glycosyltransferase n=1 Tax=Pyrobaculum sp. TaxID=2004705 RepID=UPI003D0C7846
MSAVFIWQWVRSTRHRYPLVLREPTFRVAVFIPVYNEDPELVKGTIRSIKSALRGRGEVYVVDDSTDRELRQRIEKACAEVNAVYFHRGERRGFKAGALNDALRKFGRGYEYVAVFDADQRPADNFFDVVMSFFRDGVAFVQAPQLYSELQSPMARAAWHQQLPFLRVVMRARHGSSAFSLGSGTVFKTEALVKAGGFVEDVITEDLATSIKIHELGFSSAYIDAELLWYGEPPITASAYIIQQTRWAFGSFQSFPILIKSKLPLKYYIDYLSGILYWFRVGVLRISEIILAPFFISIYFLPEVFIWYYVISFGFHAMYLIIMKRVEKDYSFTLHKGIEYVASVAATAAFISWIMGRKLPFRVTPKREVARCTACGAPLLAYMAVLAAL